MTDEEKFLSACTNAKETEELVKGMVIRGIRELMADRDKWEARAKRYEWEDDQGPNDDRPLPEDEAIDATHPCNNPGSGYGAADMEAMRLVGAKRSKRGLVDLVRWLLVDRDRWKARAEKDCTLCTHYDAILDAIGDLECPNGCGFGNTNAWQFDEARFKAGE